MRESKFMQGYVWAHIDGEKGPRWVEANKIRVPDNFKQPPLNSKQLETISMIKTMIDEVFPRTADEWADCFRRELNIVGKMTLWLYLAFKYQEYTRAENFLDPEKKEIFSLMVSCMDKGKEETMKTARPKFLSIVKAQDVVEYYFNPTPRESPDFNEGDGS